MEGSRRRRDRRHRSPRVAEASRTADQLEGRHGPPLRLQTAIEREHGTPSPWVASGKLPPALAPAAEVAKHGACRLAIGHIAALAGIFPRSVRNAIRAAEVLGSSPSRRFSEIAIRALSSAVNDTYTGLICIDWLGEALRMLVAPPMPDEAWRTRRGEIRLLFPPVEPIVPTAFDLIRQAGASNPAVIIRLLQTYGSPRCCATTISARRSLIRPKRPERPRRMAPKSVWIERRSMRRISWPVNG